MSDSASPQTNKQADLQRSYGTNWTKANVETLNEWITIAAFNIQILTYASQYHQRLLRNNIILGLLLSTASGTISAARFGLQSSALTDNVLNGLFTAMSFLIALFTGCLKVYSIQERLEEFLRIKQEWIVFSTAITSELQLPTQLRHDALYTIVKNKAKYLDLLKANPEIPPFCLDRVKKEFGNVGDADVDATNLPKTMLSIAATELLSFDTEAKCPAAGVAGTTGATATVAGTTVTASDPLLPRSALQVRRNTAQTRQTGKPAASTNAVASETTASASASVPVTMTVSYESASLEEN